MEKQRWNGRDDLENTDEEQGGSERLEEMETDGQRADEST